MPVAERAGRVMPTIVLIIEVAVALVHCRQVAIYAGAPRSGEFLITDV